MLIGTTPPRAPGAQRGMSIVELMVGIALGLFLVAGASTLFVTHLTNGRRLLVEARLNQDLRAAADLITRDIRRAGYWGDSLTGTVAVGASGTTATNPYRVVAGGAGTISYGYSRDGATDNNVLNNNEQFGFDLNNNTIRMQTDGTPTWQAVTDPDTLTVTALTIADTSGAPVLVGDACAKPFTNTGTGAVEACCDTPRHGAGLCAAGQAVNWGPSATCPTITVRQYTVTITGQATRDPTVTRTLQTSVRVRNDLFGGTCPA
ncbi:MAG TPA: hypothetical protein VN277_06620 [Acidiferrobacterales bacterium]|nr:hypothetical protein [Acidiferrobacterales bacterium]